MKNPKYMTPTVKVVDFALESACAIVSSLPTSAIPGGQTGGGIPTTPQTPQYSVSSSRSVATERNDLDDIYKEVTDFEY